MQSFRRNKIKYGKREKNYSLQSHKWTSGFLVHLTTTNPVKSPYKCTAVELRERHQNVSATIPMNKEKYGIRRKNNKIRMSHEHKNSTFCESSPIQVIFNDVVNVWPTPN